MTITNIPDTPPIKHSELKEGSEVLIDGKIAKLGESLGKGGEGEVFSLPNSLVAKIYLDKSCNPRQKKKIECMVNLGLRDSQIAAPISIITDKQRRFCGYVMPKVNGQSLEKIMSSPIPSERWKNWTRKNLVEVCLCISKILNKVYSIKDHSIVICDLNFGNFMSTAPGKVILVDFDSVQIDDFPCPVGTGKFTPPEILKTVHNRRTILLDKYNEQFTVAILFFYILCGIHPFSRKGGNTPEENILSGVFPYNLDGSVQDLAPIAGNPSFYWAFLPKYIRQAFTDTFSIKNSNTGRTDIKNWILLFERYLNDFEAIVKKDSESNRIILTRYPNWNIPKDVEKCVGCNTLKPKDQITNHLCLICQKLGYTVIQRTCKYCGKKEWIGVLGTNRPQKGAFICQECRKEETCTCVACNKKFCFSHYERDSYIFEGNIICPSCRDKFETYEENLNKLLTVPDPIPFEKIDFISRCDSVVTSAKTTYLPFFRKIKGQRSETNIKKTIKTIVIYQVQAEQFPKVQSVLANAINNISDTPSSLFQSISILSQEIKKLESGIEKVDYKAECFEIKYSDTPYYKCMIDCLNNYRQQWKTKLDGILSELIISPKRYLSIVEDSLTPEKFFSIDHNILLADLYRERDSLIDKSEFVSIKRIYNKLCKCIEETILAIKLKEEWNTNFFWENKTDIDNYILWNKRMTQNISTLYFSLGNSLCNFLTERLLANKDLAQKMYNYFDDIEEIKRCNFSSIEIVLSSLCSYKIPDNITVAEDEVIKTTLKKISSFIDEYHYYTKQKDIIRKYELLCSFLSENNQKEFSEYAFYTELALEKTSITDLYNKTLYFIKQKEAKKKEKKEQYIILEDKIINVTSLLFNILFTLVYFLILVLKNSADGIIDYANYYLYFAYWIPFDVIFCAIIKYNLKQFFLLKKDKYYEQKHANSIRPGSH